MAQSNDTPLFRPHDLLVAGALLTRLPLPHAPDAAFARQAAATWAYPLIGAVLAGLAGLVWGVAAWLDMGTALQSGLVLLCLVVMTGALHEDGLADSADGLWGGHTRDRRLEIMKDSRIGAYGVIALVLILGLRWQALGEVGVAALIAAASLSRAFLPMIMCLMPQARDTGLARSVGGPPLRTAWVSLAFGVVISLMCLGFSQALLAVLTGGAIALVAGQVARAKIGGITGDILGATQVLSELGILIALGLIAAA